LVDAPGARPHKDVGAIGLAVYITEITTVLSFVSKNGRDDE